MRTAVILIFVVVTGTGGEICLTHAMKLLGEVHDFRPRAIFGFVLRALRVGWLWFGVLLMTASFFSFLAMLVLVSGQLCDSRDVAGLRGRGIRREAVSGRAAECHALGRNRADLLRCRHGLGGRSAGNAALRHSALIMLRWAILALALGPLVYYLMGIYSAWRFFRVAHRASTSAANPQAKRVPAVSVLKPVRGLDPDAYENFASFCRQDYPEFEILFAVSDAVDPVVPVIEKLIADFPARSIRLVVVAERLGPNSKVSNLCRLVREARHDLLVITDSDVRSSRDICAVSRRCFAIRASGGVTALYRGSDNLQLVAAMDCVGSSAAFCGAALVARELEGLKFMMGSTMATTKQRLAEIGGFEAMVDLHSDDYELGRRIADAATASSCCPSRCRWRFLRKLWAPTCGTNCAGPSESATFVPAAISECCSRMVCRGRSPRRASRLRPPWARLILARILCCDSRWPGRWASGDCAIRCCGAGFWLLPVRDLLSFFVWLASFGMNRIEWRGSAFTLEKGRMVPVAPRAGRS